MRDPAVLCRKLLVIVDFGSLTLFWTGSGRTLYWTGGQKAPRVNSAI